MQKVFHYHSDCFLNAATSSTGLIRSVRASTTSENFTKYKNTPLKSWREIPGPYSLPVLGTMHHFFPGGLFHSFNGIALDTKLFETYGPIVRLDHAIGRDPQIFLYDAEGAGQILRGESSTPIRPGFSTLQYYRKNVKKDRQEGKPTGLITDTGEVWKELRSAVNPLMLKPKTVKLYKTVLDEVAKDMVARIKSLTDENNRLTTNFIDEMNLWSLESTSIVALGCRIGCFDPNLPEDSPSKKLIYCVPEMIKVIKKLDFSPTLWQVIQTQNYKRAIKLYELQESIAEYFLDKAQKEYNNRTNQDEEKSVLEKLLEINKDYATAMASDMLIAGVDTLANTIASAIYLLAVNPEKQNILREELHSSDDIRPYLKACLKESTRILPVIAATRRLTTKEYNVLGYRIPPNMWINMGHHFTSMMEEHYHRPKEFLPERWLVEENDPLNYRRAHSFAHGPFGFGVRNCVGRRIAELMLETFIARMVENFHIEWSGSPPTIEQTILNYFMEPYNFVFKNERK